MFQTQRITSETKRTKVVDNAVRYGLPPRTRKCIKIKTLKAMLVKPDWITFTRFDEINKSEDANLNYISGETQS